MRTIAQHLQEARNMLEGISSTPQLDTELLLAHVLKRDRLWILTNNEGTLSPEQEQKFLSLLGRRSLYEPMAYILGEQEFFSLGFFVNEHVLIPRPESEMLVEEGLQFLRMLKTQDPKREPYQVLDLGTGSGCLLIALLVRARKEGILLHGHAIEQSVSALEVARKNAERHGVFHDLQFFESSWYEALPENKTFDLILANPPYIAQNDESRSPETDYEPSKALFAEDQGLSDIREILAGLSRHLASPGLLCMECGWHQEKDIQRMVQEYSLHERDWQYRCTKDLAGLDRMITLYSRTAKRRSWGLMRSPSFFARS